MKEHDRVVMKFDIREYGLKTRDVGTTVHIYDQGKAYKIELVSLKGETIAVVTIEAQQIRPVRDSSPGV